MQNKVKIKSKALLRFMSASLRLLRAAGLRGLIVAFVGVITALACSYSYITDHSVRFNSFRSGRGFYRLPPLPVMFDAKTGKELGMQELAMEASNYEPNNDDSEISPVNEMWANARTAVEREDLNAANVLFQQYLKVTNQQSINDDAERQRRRNSVYDLMDAMTALQQGSNSKSVIAYMYARYAFHDYLKTKAENLITDAANDKNLNDNWDYLRAAILYSNDLRDDALNSFQEFSSKYPRSEKIQAVLYMIAKIRLEESYAFNHAGCGIMGVDAYGEQIDQDKVEPADKCRDQNWNLAAKAFRVLVQKYPQGRYYYDSRGWLAYLYRRGGMRELALAEYYKLLGNPTNRNMRLEAKKSLQMLGHDYDDGTLDRVETMIAGDAETAMAYAYHRIYNYAIDLTYQNIESQYPYDEKSEAVARTHVANTHKKGDLELSRVARFATAMMKRYPRAKVSGGFVLRVAEAQLELQNFREALKLSKRALVLGQEGDLRTQALWVKGSCEHQIKHYKSARSTFTQLITEFPNSRLTEGARRLMAMTAEDQGDFETALEQYLALGYAYDVAYYVDVMLPTNRLAKFVERHKYMAEYNELLYGLGIRYMREKRWSEAAATLWQVVTKSVRDTSYTDENVNLGRFSKEPDMNGEDNAHYIKSSWVMQDLKTIEILERLEQTVESAKNDEEKAEAMYQLASFQFGADSLLFYNPAVWRGLRSELLFTLSESANRRLPGESQMIFEHSLSHETIAQAIPIYQKIFDLYPQTHAAQDALFTEVVAHERLANLNEYWRDIYSRGLFVGTRIAKMADVTRNYPRFRWPISRLGWEASTRTVNGGPAYPPPPKPAPKYSFEQRIQRKLDRIFDGIVEWIQKKAGSATDEIVAFLRENIYFVFLGMVLLAMWKYSRIQRPL